MEVEELTGRKSLNSNSISEEIENLSNIVERSVQYRTGRTKERKKKRLSILQDLLTMWKTDGR